MAGILLYKIHVFAGAFWLQAERNELPRGFFNTPPRSTGLAVWTSESGGSSHLYKTIERFISCVAGIIKLP